MIVEFLPDPTSNNTNHDKSSQRPIQPDQRPDHHVLNLPKRTDRSPKCSSIKKTPPPPPPKPKPQTDTRAIASLFAAWKEKNL